LIRISKYIGFPIALLIAGSAISLMSCGKPEPKSSETSDEKIISRTVHDMAVLSSDNGMKRRLMLAPLMEEHAFAEPSFEEFREGMEVIGYDSLGVNPSSRVLADHALHWAERDLWQLSGNVVVEGEEGQKLYTQQLFWDVKTQKIWSNVDSKVEEAGDVLYGMGFEAMDDFSRWEFRGVDGTVGVDVEPTEPTADSMAVTGTTPVSDSMAFEGSSAQPAATSVTSPFESTETASVESTDDTPAQVTDSLPTQP
jgi:LPS export ABC transporter protein LptC